MHANLQCSHISMATFTSAPAYVEARLLPFPPLTCPMGHALLQSKQLFWISGWRIVSRTRNPFFPGILYNSNKRAMLVFPRATFGFDTPAGLQLSEFGQNMLRAFEIEASKFLPGSPATEELHSGTPLHHFSAIPTEFFVSAVGLLLGTSVGYLLSKFTQKEHSGDFKPFAERLLIMNSTPFNRFVLMRCPSLVFKDLDVYEGLSKKLTAEGHHVVRIGNNDGHSVRDTVNNNEDNTSPFSMGDGTTGHWLQSTFNDQTSFQRHNGMDKNMGNRCFVYQRTFLNAKDGGVLAIDWPSHLELSGEHGLDTIFLLIPGSLIGSKSAVIQDFVQMCAKRGFFPLVLNPRGCGGSPLTTPRLFTAGDSDDVRTAVEFILKSRPSATIMSIGWGYGANMLLKYLGEEAASTPVTAAICIENIFDLEESSKLPQDDHINMFNLTRTQDFVEILKSNQMLFEGKGKGFNLQKGLSAKTVREFDEAISMVSKGYENVQDFYKDSSSKYWINRVKIPILCVQDDASIGSTFSIPRHVFEENPFTTLILQLTGRGLPASETNVSAHSALMIEWLAAVELAFLKGRHPLLHGIEVTFKPPIRERTPAELSLGAKEKVVLMAKKANGSVGMRSGKNFADSLPSANERSEDLRPEDRVHSTYQNMIPNDTKALIGTKDNGHEFESADSLKGELNEPQGFSETESSDNDSAEVEQGQVRLAAESVLKVLDINMPGTLSDQKKEEVLEAVGRGETIVSALQEACPEDVREKMVTSVSAAVQAKGISLKLAGFGKNMPPPKLPAGMVEKLQEKVGSLVHSESPVAPMSDTTRIDMPDSDASGSNPPVESGDKCSSSGQDERAQKVDTESSPTRKVEPSAEDQTENGAVTEAHSKTSSKVEPVSQKSSPESEKLGDVSVMTEKEAGGTEGKPVGRQNNGNEPDSMHAEMQSDPLPQEEAKDRGPNQKQETSAIESQASEPKTEKNNGVATNSSSIVPEQDCQENSMAESPSNTPNTSPCSSLDLGLAVEALTGVDDSTQMAVTNVFGVIENVLEQLEKDRGKKNEQSQQSQNEELPESGQTPKQSNQGQKYEHSKQAPLTLPDSPMPERNMESSNNSFLQSQPLRDLSGQKGSHEGTPNPECLPEKGYANLKNMAGIEYNDHLNNGSCSSPSTASSSLERLNLGKEKNSDDTDVALEYFEDENVWKLNDVYSDINKFPDGGTNGVMNVSVPVMNSKIDTIVSKEENRVSNPENVILDGETKRYKHEEVCMIDTVQCDDGKPLETSLGRLISTKQPCGYSNMMTPLQTEIEALLMNSLELELVRRLGKSDSKLLGDSLRHEIEVVSLTMAETVVKALEDRRVDCTDNEVPQKALTRTVDKVHVDIIVCAVNRTYEELVDLPGWLPAGVLLGIILAALGPLEIIASHDEQHTKNSVQTHPDNASSMNSLSPVPMDNDPGFLEREFNGNGVGFGKNHVTQMHENIKFDEPTYKEKEMDGDNCNKMVGAMAAAVGATSALATQENFNGRYSDEGSGSKGLNDVINSSVSEKNDNLLDKDESGPTMVSTLAEKAMSVAAPVVPTKQDGGVDHERLVGLLAGLGQKGGILRFVGKAALLWGGLRGAMSLTDRLLGFLHISDRPLYQRISGFMMMVVLIWLPVLVPLLPSLLQQWASGSRNGIASTGALIGLYCAVVILVNIWGKKICGYDDALYHYGIRNQPGSYARQRRALLSGLILGLSLLVLVYLLGMSLQFIQLNWAQDLLFTAGSKTILGTVAHSWRIFKAIVECFCISLAVSFVEELFFRSWLQREISTDLGFHNAALLSGLAFSLTHGSLSLVPGLFFLSYILTGVKAHCNGDLNLAIGIHAGLMAGTQLINMFVQVKYRVHASIWFIGRQSTDPFSGLIGISLLAVLALIIYPWRLKEKTELNTPA